MSYKIISQFIKDISFEIPNAQTFAILEKEISKYTPVIAVKKIKKIVLKAPIIHPILIIK